LVDLYWYSGLFCYTLICRINLWSRCSLLLTTECTRSSICHLHW